MLRTIIIIGKPTQNLQEGHKSSELADLKSQMYAVLLCHVAKQYNSVQTA